MRYSAEQHKKFVTRQEQKTWRNAVLERRVKEEFPIEVKIEGDYFVIESKMNYDVHT